MHRQTQHGGARGGLGLEGDDADWVNNPITYRMAFPLKAGPRPSPVEGCSGRAWKWRATMMHFWNWHIRDTVVILEEGNLPHPQ